MLSFKQTLRVRRPARSGALAAALALWHADASGVAAFGVAAFGVVYRCIEALLTEVAHATQPWECLHARRDAVAAWHGLGKSECAADRLGASTVVRAVPAAAEARALSRLAMLEPLTPAEPVHAVW